MAHPRRKSSKVLATHHQQSPKIPKKETLPTLDGQQASISFPRAGDAIVTTPGGRRLTIKRERAQTIMARDGEFTSPAFARPQDTR